MDLNLRDHLRRLRWSCLGCALAVLGAAWAPRGAAAMDFHAVPGNADCPDPCAVAQGAIDADTALDFERFVQSQPARAKVTLVIDSLGGRMLVGIALGEAIRKRGFNTVVGRYDGQAGRLGPGGCASACVYVFMGGVDRAVVSGSRFGVHQVRLDRKELTARDAQLMMGLAGEHVDQAGATGELLVLALATPPENIRWLSRGELVRIHVVTDAAAPGPGDKEAQALETAAVIRFRLLGANIREAEAPQASQSGNGQ